MTAGVGNYVTDNPSNLGKYVTADTWETGITGPFDQWPTGLGFERFYGNVIGESDQIGRAHV